ncbi:MAG TPA: hypothetical protein DHV36_16520 [Desulfobacteraceae bacterium]|nr:hypothetical protein [Desulfobacteraceae bacterium]
MDILEVKHLKMVRAIAEAGNMTRAAKVLCLSQSALSQQLKDVETRLGSRLFFRTRKQMLLTPAGKRIRHTAESVLFSLAETETDIARMVTGETGELRVGTQCIFCYRWLPAVMREFHERFSNVEIEIGRSLDASRELTGNIHDLVISVVPESLDGVDMIPLFRDEFVAIVPPDHPLAGTDHLELNEFKGVNLISARPKENNYFYQNGLKRRGIEPLGFMAVEDPGAMVEMVAAGFGLAMAPLWAVRSIVDSGRVRAVRVTRKGVFLTWQAVHLKSDPVPVFLKTFIRLVGQAGITGQGA